MGISPLDGCHIRSFFRKGVCRESRSRNSPSFQVGKYVHFSPYVFFSDGCFVVNHLIQMDVHLKWVGMRQLFETYVTVFQSGSLPLEMQLKGLDFPYQLVTGAGFVPSTGLKYIKFDQKAGRRSISTG